MSSDTATAEDLPRRIEAVLAAEIQPVLGAHAGSIELVAVEEERVSLRFVASCDSCYFRRACVVNLVRPTLAAHFGDSYEFVVEGAGR